jgi:hypothetical protein
LIVLNTTSSPSRLTKMIDDCGRPSPLRRRDHGDVWPIEHRPRRVIELFGHTRIDQAQDGKESVSGRAALRPLGSAM